MIDRARVAVAIGACLLTAGSATALRAQTGDRFGGNLLIVTVDALRADRLGVAGHRVAERSITPNLDALARRGAYFKRVWSQTPDGARALGSLLTSRHPADVAWARPGAAQPRLRDANVSLFEALAAAGHRTIGVVPRRISAARLGFGQGLAEWLADGPDGAERRADDDAAADAQTIARATARLEQAGARKERFALWTHLAGPRVRAVSPGADQTSARAAAAEYDAAIASLDGSIGALLAALDRGRLTTTTAVVVLGTHGAALGAHAGQPQGTALFEEQLRVPLIIAVPGTAPMTVDIPTAGIDLAPTLLDLVGRDQPAEFQGESLLAHVRNRAGPGDKVRPVHAELLPGAGVTERAAMLVVDGFKLIHRPERGRFELYSLREDRAESQNLVADPNYKVAFETLRRRLATFERRVRQAPR